MKSNELQMIIREAREAGIAWEAAYDELDEPRRAKSYRLPPTPISALVGTPVAQRMDAAAASIRIILDSLPRSEHYGIVKKCCNNGTWAYLHPLATAIYNSLGGSDAFNYDGGGISYDD